MYTVVHYFPRLQAILLHRYTDTIIKTLNFTTQTTCVRFCFNISAFDVTGQRTGKSQGFIGFI